MNPIQFLYHNWWRRVSLAHVRSACFDRGPNCHWNQKNLHYYGVQLCVAEKKLLDCRKLGELTKGSSTQRSQETNSLASPPLLCAPDTPPSTHNCPPAISSIGDGNERDQAVRSNSGKDASSSMQAREDEPRSPGGCPDDASSGGDQCESDESVSGVTKTVGSDSQRSERVRLEMAYLMDGVSLELQPQCDHSDMSPPIPGAERLSSDGEIAVHLDVEERLSLVVTPQRQLNTGEQERALSELKMGEGAKTVPGTSQTTSEMRMEEDRTQVVPVNPENDRANLGETEGDFGTLRTRDETLLQDSQVSGGKIKQGGKAMIETIATGTEARESVSKDSKPNDGLGNAEREKTPDIQKPCTTETSQLSQECVLLEMHQEGDSVKVTVAIAPSGVEDGCSEAKLDDGQRVETGSTDHLDESVKVSLSTDGDSCSLSLTVNTQANSSKDPLEGLPPVHEESTGNADGDGVSVAQLKEEAEILEAEIDKERQTLQQEKQKLEKHLGVLMKVMEKHEEAESRASTPGNLQQLEVPSPSESPSFTTSSKRLFSNLIKCSSIVDQAERLSLMKEIEQEKECLAAIVSTLASSMMSPRLESSVQEGARSDITNTGSPLPMDESIEQDGKLTVGGADRFRPRRKVEGGVITRSDGARINATIFHIEKGGLLHGIATVKHNGEDYCVDAGLLESLDGSIPLSKIIGEHGHLAGNVFFDFIDRGHGDIEDVNGEDVVGGILEAIAGDGKVQEMAIEGEDDCLDFDSLKRLSPEMPLDVLFAKHGHLAALEGQGQISKVTLIGRPVVWSFYGKVKYTLVEIPENGETCVTLLRKAVVKHQGQSYLVDKDTFEYMIRGEAPTQIIKKHREVPRDASPQAPCGSPPVEVRHIEDVAGNRLKYLVMEQNGNDKSGKYVAIAEHGGQRYGFDLDMFENAVGSVPIAQLVAKYSHGSVVQGTEIVSKNTKQTHDGRSEHPLSEIFSEHGDLSSKGLLGQDEGGVDSKTVITTVSLAGPSGEREMAVVKHADKTCYVPLQIMDQYPKQLTTIVSKHGMFVPNPEQEVRCMMCGDGWDICYNATKIGRIRRRQVATVPFNGKQYELGTFESSIRQQLVLFRIEEHGKLVQKISPHLDPTKLRCLVEECLDEDGMNRVKKVVISTGKDDYELELGKLETLVSHMLLEETASKHGAVRAKSQKSLSLRDLTLNTTREVDKGEKTLRSPSGRDIVVIVKEMVFFEEASQETEEIKRRIRLEFENNSGVEYEVLLDVLEGRLATMDVDDISRQFATLRKSQQSQEEGGDVQEDVEPVLESQTVKGVSVKEITFWSDKSAGGLGGGEEKQVASVGFEGALIDLNVLKRLAPKISVQAFLSAIDGQEEEGSFGVDLQECQGVIETPLGERVVFMAGETILDENHRLGPSTKNNKNKSTRRKKVLIEVEDVIYEIELGSWEFASQTMLAEIVAKGGTVRHRSEGDDHVEEVASKQISFRVEEREVEDEQGKRQETVATVEFEIDECGVELATFKIAIDSMPPGDIFEKYGKLCTLEIAPAKHHFTAAVSSLVSAAKVALVIVKSKKKAKKAKKENHRYWNTRGKENFCHTGTETLLAGGTISIQVLDDRQGKDLQVLQESNNCKLPRVEVDIPLLTEKDFQNFVCKQFMDFGAAPFFQIREDVQVVRKCLEAGGENKKIRSKIENAEGNCKEIPQVTDGVMVARDDLGTKIPKVQKVPPPQTMTATKTEKIVICGAVEKASHRLSPLRFERRIPPPPRSRPQARLATIGGEEEMCNLQKLQLFLELDDQVWEDEEGVELNRLVAKRNLCLALKEELREEGFSDC
ncbi:hypothetical protein BSKO_04737 [Bryopsis sp. KO-2023]|nr:hypothetical protein BSKO_04737 [Bryopsis sp. KO-2023]